MKKILEVKNLTKYYGEVLAVDNLSFELNEGEIFGFIGPNGAGKSTTIRAIMNLINKNEGKILFLGKELVRDDISLKELIGYLPSEVRLYDDLTVREILDFHESFYKKDIHKKRCNLVNKLKLDENKKIEELSFGNLKKVGIVLTLMHSPKLIILDEATSGLDPIMQGVLIDLLKEEKKNGATIFYSTHILSEIEKVCDRVGILKEGKLLKVLSVDEVRNNNITNISIYSDDIDKIVLDLGLVDYFKEDNVLRFKLDRDVNILISKLSKYKVDKLLVTDSTLDELLMDYYK